MRQFYNLFFIFFFSIYAINVNSQENQARSLSQLNKDLRTSVVVLKVSMVVRMQ